MMTESTKARTLTQTPIILDPERTATGKDLVLPGFYEELATEFGGFIGHFLISEHAFETDWGMWEMHPDGDEFIYLLSGAADFVYRENGDDHVVRLAGPGEYLVVPKGAWHTARTDRDTRALFVTPGAGTEHAETPPA